LDFLRQCCRIVYHGDWLGQQWFTRIDDALDAFPKDEETPMRDVDNQYGSLYDRASYGL
jgi:hypothetical protein